VQIPRSYLNEQGHRVFPLDFFGEVDFSVAYDPYTADDESDEPLDEEGDFLEPEVTSITPELLADLRAEQAEREKVIAINSTNHHPTISPADASNLKEARNSDQPRHPKGTPIGGQFAPKAGGTADLAISKTLQSLKENDPSSLTLLSSENDPTAHNKVTVLAHTKNVMRHFEKQLDANKDYLSDLSKQLGFDPRPVLEHGAVLHDIGKPLAIAKNDKRHQHKYTEPIFKNSLTDQGFSEPETTFAWSVFGHDWMGIAVRGKVTPEAAVTGIANRARYANLSPAAFALISKLFYLSDVAAYPRMKSAFLNELPNGSLEMRDSKILDQIIDELSNLQEAYNHTQPRVPKGHGKESGRWAARGSMSMIAVLEAHYNEIRPSLDTIAEKYTGRPGQKVEAQPDEWTEQETEAFRSEYASKYAARVLTDPDEKRVYVADLRAGGDTWGGVDALKRFALDHDITLRQSPGWGDIGWKVSEDQREKFQVALDRFLETPAGEKFLLGAIEQDAHTTFARLTHENQVAGAREVGVEFPTRTIGAPVPWTSLGSQRADLVETYLKRVPPTPAEIEQAKRLARESYEKYGTVPWDEFSAGMSDTDLFGYELGQLRHRLIDEMPDQARHDRFKVAGIDLPVYTRTPTQFRPFNSAPGGAQDVRDYGHSQNIVRQIQHDRTIAIAREKGIDLTSEQADDLARKLWGAWKSDSGSELGLALQAASYDELRSHHRADPEREKKALEGYRTLGSELDPQAEADASKRLTDIHLRRKALDKERLDLASNPPSVVRPGGKERYAQMAADIERRRKELDAESHRAHLERDERIINAGKAAVQAHVRATWESSQYILDRAGVRDQPIQTYRAIIRDMADIEAGKPKLLTITPPSSPVTKDDIDKYVARGIKFQMPWVSDALIIRGMDPDYPHSKEATTVLSQEAESNIAKDRGAVYATKLPDFKMQRNGAQSTTLDLDGVANTWQGAGGVSLEGPPVNDRVVLRIQTPAASVLSLPVHGQNVYGEIEIVLTGLAWERWDAWQSKAPPIATQSRAELIQSIIRSAKKLGINKSPEAAANEADLVIGDRGAFTFE